MTTSPEQRHEKAKIKCIKALDAACKAMNDLLLSSIAAGVPLKGDDDGRKLLLYDMREFSGYLEATTKRPGR